MYLLDEHELDSAFDTPPAIADAAAAPIALAPAPSKVRRADGAPIGLGAYCEMVTPSYRWDWAHLRLIDAVLDRVAAGEAKRVIINMPPRHGKTEKTTVRQAAYRLELDPALPIIVAGYNGTFAQKLSRKIRRVARGRVELSDERNAVADWETVEGGGVRAVGVGEGVAGLPAGLILLDDPIKNKRDAASQAFRDHLWDWYTEDIYTRLEPNGAIVITMTRRHEDDIVGRILAGEDAADWEVINLPAIAEEGDALSRTPGEALCRDRFDERMLDKIRRTIGSSSFASLYQQRPAPADGLIYKAEWWRYYTTKDHPIVEDGRGVPFLPDVLTSHLQSWDCSFKDKKQSDKVSGQVWSRLGANCYLIDRFNDRRDFVATVKAVKDMTKKHPRALLKLVEDKANGPAVISALRANIPGLVPVTPEGDKVARAHAVTPMYEAGNVWLPHPAIAPWIEQWKLEHIQFPFGRNDDDVDAANQALWRMFQQINGASPVDDLPSEPSEAVAVAGMRF